MTSNAWKRLEKLVAEELKGKRVLRGDDFSRKDVDVEVEDFQSLRIDAKYRSGNLAHHSLPSLEPSHVPRGDTSQVL